MELCLSVSSYQKTSLGADDVRIFRMRGGTIGRGRDNDWILPDADRVVSTHHARVLYESGGYYIEDTSSNGTYVNNDERLAHGQRRLLRHGDTLCIGEYEIHVRLQESGAGHPSAAPGEFVPRPYPAERRDSEGWDDAMFKSRPEPSQPTRDPLAAHPPRPSGAGIRGEPTPLGAFDIQSDHLAADRQSFVPPRAAAPLIPDDNLSAASLPAADQILPDDWWKGDDAEPEPNLEPAPARSGAGRSAAPGSGAAPPVDPSWFGPSGVPPAAAPIPESLARPFDAPPPFEIPAAPRFEAPAGAGQFGAPPIRMGEPPSVPSAARESPRPASDNGSAAPAWFDPHRDPTNQDAERAAAPAWCDPAAATTAIPALELPETAPPGPAPERPVPVSPTPRPPPQASPLPCRATSPAAPAQAPPQVPAPQGGPDPRRLLAALFEGLGLKEASPAPEKLSEDWFRHLGALLRLTTQGTQEALRARMTLKSEFRLSQTIVRPARNNPLKFAVDTDQALRYLFVGGSPGFMDAESAFAEAFRDIRNHEVAVVAGMRAAFERLLREFAPETVEAALQARGKRAASLPFSNRNWAYYKEYHSDFVANAGDDFQGIFGEDFVRAYEEQIRSLEAADR